MRVEYKFLNFFGDPTDGFTGEDFPLGKDIPMRIESVKAEIENLFSYSEQVITITFRIMQK